MKNVFLLIVSLTLCTALPAAAQDTWSDEATPMTNWLFDVWGNSDDHMFAVGTQGRIFYHNASGWVQQNSGVTEHLYAVWGRSESDVIAVGRRGTILRYDGSSWGEVLHGLTAADLHAVWGTDNSSELFVAGDAGTILYYSGSAWSSLSSGTAADLRGIWGTSPDNVIAVGASGTILRYDGTSWSAMASESTRRLNSIWGSSSSSIFAVGDLATILRYDGDGNNDGIPDAIWESTISYPSPNGVWLYDVWGTADGGSVYAVGTHGAVLHSADNGTTWSDNEPGIGTPHYSKHNMYGIGGLPSGSRIVAVGLDGTIKECAAGTWAEVKLSDDTVMWLYDIWGSAPDNAYAVGDGGLIMRYDGTGWTAMASNTTYVLYGVWGSSASDVFAVGKGGRIRRYDGNPSGTWSGMTSPTTNNLNAVWGSSSSDVYAVGNSGTIVYYNGTEWAKVNHGLTSDALNGVWGSSPCDVYAVGNAGTLLHYDGAQWEIISHGLTTVTLNSIWGSSSSDIYAVGNCTSIGSCRVIHYNGTGWSLVENCGTNSNLRDIWGSAPDDIFIVESTKRGVLHYDGVSWQRTVLDPLPDGSDHWFEAVWGTSWDNLIAVGVHQLGMAATIMHHKAACHSNADCDDGTFCNGSETCNCDSGTCQPGAAACPGRLCSEDSDACVDCLIDAHCSDANPCTDDVCNAGHCEHVNNIASCDDGLFCNGSEMCSSGTCLSSGNPCHAAQTCNEAMDVCEDAPISTTTTVPSSGSGGGASGNGSGSGSSTPPPPPKECTTNADCPAAKPYCTSDGNTCVQCLNDANCSDSLFCNGQEICFNSECFAGAQPCAEDEICSEQTGACAISAPDECQTEADCDDGVACNGAESCNDGKCVPGEAFCAADQLCREAREQCWSLRSLASTTTFNPELGERTVVRPLLLEQRCIWLRVMAESSHHFDAGKSRVTLQKSGESFAGVTLDQTRTPVRGLLFENAVWLPVCISKDAAIGRWEIRIETEVSDAEALFLETIQGFFVVQ